MKPKMKHFSFTSPNSLPNSLTLSLTLFCALTGNSTFAETISTTSTAQTPTQAPTLTVISHNSFELDKKLVAQFEKQTGAKLRFIKGGDAGELLSKLILTRRAPLADVVYGLDNSMLKRAVEMNLLQKYSSSKLAQVPAEYRLEGKWLNSVNYGYVGLNYERKYFTKHNIELPKTLEELSKPEYAKLTVVTSPATSSPGLAFLLATVNYFGEEKAWEWWRTARANGMKVSRGWSDAYYKEFSKNGGKYPIVLSYASSPAAEVFYAKDYDPKKMPKQSPTAPLFLKGSSYLQIEGVGILKGSKQRRLASKFINFMLSDEVQQSIPTSLWVYPAVENTNIDPVFRFAEKPKMENIDPELMNDPQRLVDAWVKNVLRKR